MPLLLVFIILKYIIKRLKNLSLINSTIKKWLKIALHVLSKNIITIIEFRIAIIFLNIKIIVLFTNKIFLAK